MVFNIFFFLSVYEVLNATTAIKNKFSKVNNTEILHFPFLMIVICR